MAPVYDYICRVCGAKTELDRRPKDGSVMRHLKEDGRVCGTFFRDYFVHRAEPGPWRGVAHDRR